MFPQTLCNGCPVKKRTGKPFCVGTPFMDLNDSEGPQVGEKARTRNYRLKARREYLFLKSLLPKKWKGK
jgi:hypothetical protein